MNISDKRIERERQKYLAYLVRSGLRPTEGRLAAFDEAMKAHGHFAPEELHRQCVHNRRKVSRATVYRSIKEMLEAGVIRKTAFGEKHAHFEHLYDESKHHHARCIRCGDIMEFPDLGEDARYHPILEKKGFEILGHEMHFYGYCKTCKGKKS